MRPKVSEEHIVIRVTRCVSEIPGLRFHIYYFLLKNTPWNLESVENAESAESVESVESHPNGSQRFQRFQHLLNSMESFSRKNKYVMTPWPHGAGPLDPWGPLGPPRALRDYNCSRVITNC